MTIYKRAENAKVILPEYGVSKSSIWTNFAFGATTLGIIITAIL